MIHELQRESMDIDNPRKNEDSPCRPKENGVHLYPVSVNDSGEGLPYAPEDWPNPGDKWVWKVGRRIAVSGFFMDRYLYLPRSFRQAGQGRCFASRLSLEQYIQKHFPDADVDAFFSSFSWKIPSKAFRRDNKEIFRNHSETSEHPVSDSPMGGCKAGNKFCSSLDTGEDSVLEIMFCDFCCSEPSFCRDCCCILCSRTINKALGAHSYIRCEATIDGYICGHNCHIECALRAYMAGTVGGSIGLEAEYYCCRCDSRTDLVSHVTKLLQTCELIDSRDDIEKILNVGICVLRGSNKTSACQLLNSIDKAMLKLKNGTYIEDIWKKGDVSAVADDNLELRAAFAQKREAETKKKAARVAPAEKKALAQRMTEAREAEAREAQERALAEGAARGEATAPRMEETEMSEDHITIQQRKRKVVASPERICISENEEGTPGSNQATGPGPSSFFQATVEPSPPAAPRNLFLDEVSPAGVRMIKSLLSPAEDAHLRGFGPSHKLFEGTTRVLSGFQMLVAAFEEVADVAKREASLARTDCDLLEQIRGELDLAHVMHNEEVIDMRTVVDGTYQQLEEVMADLEGSGVEAKVFKAQAETLGDGLEILEARANEAVATQSKSEEEWRASFLQSKEFKQAVEDRAYPFFQIGFQKCKEQFEEAGLLPVDREDFPDLDRAIASLPDETDEETREEDTDALGPK